jgi:hypothetical protein
VEDKHPGQPPEAATISAKMVSMAEHLCPYFANSSKIQASDHLFAKLSFSKTVLY